MCAFDAVPVSSEQDSNKWILQGVIHEKLQAQSSYFVLSWERTLCPPGLLLGPFDYW